MIQGSAFHLGQRLSWWGVCVCDRGSARVTESVCVCVCVLFVVGAEGKHKHPLPGQEQQLASRSLCSGRGGEGWGGWADWDQRRWASFSACQSPAREAFIIQARVQSNGRRSVSFSSWAWPRSHAGSRLCRHGDDSRPLSIQSIKQIIRLRMARRPPNEMFLCGICGNAIF